MKPYSEIRSPSQVQKQLERLEAGGILVNKMVGNTKMFSINPRLAIRKELGSLLEKGLALMTAEETQKYFRERRRARRTGKKL
jgi:hypothetical protein